MSEASAFSERPIGRRRSDRIAGASAATRQTVEQATAAARLDSCVLVTGPEGSGREHVARAVHSWSNRAGRPFEVFSASSTAEPAHHRELFGTHPDGELLLAGGHDGALQRAGDGSVLVKDVDKLSAPARESLLRALRSGSYHREADGQTLPLRARVMFTAEEASALGDLPVSVVALAPLAEREEDILPLAVHFLSLFAEEEGTDAVGFTADARRCLIDEAWPGNVRELRERIRQAVRLAGDGAISVEALALAQDGDEVPSFKEAKRSFETRYVKGLLRRCGGNISRAARLAKKDRKDFYDVIRRTGVDPAEFRS